MSCLTPPFDPCQSGQTAGTFEREEEIYREPRTRLVPLTINIGSHLM